jgi:hypothetical protein
VDVAEQTAHSRKEGPMAYYKVRIEVWCDWDPEDSNLEELVRHVLLGEDSICTLQEVVKVVDRPQDIDNEEAMSFFGGQEGDARSKPRVGRTNRSSPEPPVDTAE